MANIIGQIKPIDGPTSPVNWALCDGRTLNIADYPALFALLAARFGGNGITTFSLPNLNNGHRFAICTEGYFPQRGKPPIEWQLATAETDYIEHQIQAFRQAYRQGILPLGQHIHVDDVDSDWLERQSQLLMDAYSQGYDPLHRHTHMNDLEPAWLERQTQVFLDAYDQRQDPLHRHTPHTHLEPAWLERQAQVLIDGYARHSHPLQPHSHINDLDPEWLERQVQVIFDALEQGHDPHFHHLHVSHLAADQLAGLLEATPGQPGSDAEVSPDDLNRIEGIGPKIATLLREAGIQTFAQLAQSTPDQLRELLRAARLHLAQPDTWPEQAALAAVGKWDELADLQKTLKGGRRV